MQKSDNKNKQQLKHGSARKTNVIQCVSPHKFIALDTRFRYVFWLRDTHVCTNPLLIFLFSASLVFGALTFMFFLWKSKLDSHNLFPLGNNILILQNIKIGSKLQSID